MRIGIANFATEIFDAIVAVCETPSEITGTVYLFVDSPPRWRQGKNKGPRYERFKRPHYPFPASPLLDTPGPGDLDTAVFGAAFVVVVAGDRGGLAIALEGKPVGGDAVPGQPLQHGLCPRFG